VTKYEHAQIGYTIIWVALGVAVFVAITGIFAQGGPGTVLIIEVILLICAVVFCKLTIRVDDKILQWSFGIGIVRKQVLLAEIAASEPIRIRWWYGWGIHLTPYGWLYNVSGLDAVAIRLRDGRKFALGTDDPQALVDAIERLISHI
jgi:hypothetical protein